MNPVPAVIAAAALSLAVVAAEAQERRSPGVHVPGLTFTFGSARAAGTAYVPGAVRIDPALGRGGNGGATRRGALGAIADMVSLPFLAIAGASGAPLTRAPASPGPGTGR